MLEFLALDTHYALRSLRRSSTLAAIAISALALGIGANTAVFSVINAVLLRPLAYPHPDRVVQLTLITPGGKGRTFSVPEFIHCRARTNILRDVAAYDFGGPGVNLTGGDQPEQVKALHVSMDYFRLFGAQLSAGRTFSADEDRLGGPRVVVIASGLWRRRFAADPDLVGSAISLGGEPYVVAGVVSPNFHPDPPADLWLPLQADPESVSQAHYLRVAARLQPGITLAGAQAQLKASATIFRGRFPLFNKDAFFGADLLRDSVVANVRTSLLILLGAVGLVLVIACANVANLLLARAAGRRREIAIRAALGAARWRIVSQLLTESLVLSLSGGLLGLLLGYIGVRALLTINPGDIPRIGEQGAAVTLDWRVLAFTAGVSVATGILFGLLPALQASSTSLSGVIQEYGSRSGSGRHASKTRALLVVTEVALALVLLAGAVLLLRSFAALRAVAPGFDVRHVLTLEMSLTGKRFEKTEGIEQVVRDAEQRLHKLRGVTAVASTWSLPLELAFSDTFNIEGRPLGNEAVHGVASQRPVSPEFFEVFRIPLLRGRLFTDRDDRQASGVVVISQAMARKFWPSGDPIGSSISIDKYIGREFAAPPRRVIGIVGDVRDWGLNHDPDPMMYVPQAQVPDGMTRVDARILPLTWVVRTKVEPFSLRAQIEKELRQASGGLAVSRVRSMQQVIGQSTARSDFNTVLLGIFAAVAMALALIGIYGLMTWSVQQRRHEIGVRVAVGAAPAQVRNMIVLQGMRLALAGVVAGVGAALATTRVLRGLVYGVKTTDPIALGGVSALLGVAALAAVWIPSRKATRVDPVEALRHE